MAGQVDAVIGAYRNFELNQMEIEGVPGRCFYLEEEGLPSYDELIYVANPERMDKAVISRFLAATERATEYIVNHPRRAGRSSPPPRPSCRTSSTRRRGSTPSRASRSAPPPSTSAATPASSASSTTPAS